MRIELCSEPEPSVLEAIARGLIDHALRAGVEPRDARPLCVVVRDEEAALVGGLSGATVWGWLHVRELWIDGPWQRSGLGTRLMETAESEARRRGCHHALLDTFDFQARPFYEKLGYRVFGELSEFPQGHARYFMSKSLV